MGECSKQIADYLVDHGLLSKLHTLLTAPALAAAEEESPMKTQVLWTISNLLDEGRHHRHLDAVRNNNLFEPLIECLASSDESIADAACWAIADAMDSGSASLIFDHILKVGKEEKLRCVLKEPNVSRRVKDLIEKRIGIYYWQNRSHFPA